MKYAVCIVPLAHVRVEPDHRSEMSNQIIFGETIEIFEEDKEGWARAANLYDGYEGWCRLNQFKKIEKPLEESGIYSGAWVNELHWEGQRLMVPFATNLKLIESCPDAEQNKDLLVIDAASTEFTEANIRKFAAVFMNTAYLWGGRSVFGIDCSGFVQSMFKLFGYKLLRDAKDQVNQGTVVSFLQAAQCGDVAFFDDEEGKIVHVGILLNSHEIVHASGNVRIDRIDNQGIIHTGTNKRTHRLRVIKKIVS